MSYYKTCPYCGARLAPGEACECLEVEAKLLIDHLTEEECAVVLEAYKKNTAPSAANTESGKVEKGLESSDSASIVH